VNVAGSAKKGHSFPQFRTKKAGTFRSRRFTNQPQSILLRFFPAPFLSSALFLRRVLTRPDARLFS
jgi:hypothetical protein